MESVVADLQKYFETFHAEIRTDYDLDSKLRDKRDKILKRIRSKLTEAKRPSFKELLQGSYKTKTGVKPIEDLEFDIDVGLRFDVDPDKVTAKDVRSWVFEAVDGHTDDVKQKRSCIRVTYAEGYHVDLVVYSCQTDDLGNVIYKLASNSDGWKDCDPPALEQYINDALDRFNGAEDSKTNTNQLRRAVRYLKRFYDESVPKESKEKPSGLAYTICVAKSFAKRIDFAGEPHDAALMRDIALAISATAGRVQAQKPTPEFEDLFGGLTDAAMDKLKERFDALAEAVRSAETSADPVEACKELAKPEFFGRDFPIPDPPKTAKKTEKPSIMPPSSSG